VRFSLRSVSGDHAGGNIELVKQHPSLAVIGGTGDGVAAVTRECTTGDEVKMANGFTARVYQCPCHTKGHILFGIGDMLFTGDTLFAAGCGSVHAGHGGKQCTALECMRPQSIGTGILRELR
jgi:hydroxyacylglutathione hydrolase